jgi:hypothetical protein
MSKREKNSQAEMTFDGLQQFLRDTGFDQSVKISNSMAFHHRESGTIITLSIPADGSTVRSADLLSVAMRLESQGLVGASVPHLLRSGKLPMAS